MNRIPFFPNPTSTKGYSSVICIVLYLFFLNFSLAQNAITFKKDSIKPITLNVVIENLVKNRMALSKDLYTNNQTIRLQNKAFNQINSEIQKAEDILERGFDYKGFTKEINLLIHWKNTAIKGITVQKNKRQTIRDLTTTSLLLNELENRTNNQINKIKKNNIALSDIQKKIDSLATDKTLYTLPKDSIARNNYFDRLVFLTENIDKTNVKLKNALDSIQTLEIKGTRFSNSLKSDIVKVEVLRKIESDSLYSRSVSIFNAKDILEKSFSNEAKHSFIKGYFVLKFYIINNASILKLLLLCIIGIFVFLKILKRKYHHKNIYPNFKYSIQIFKRPLATALVITISISQLFIPAPPFIFMAILWTIASISICFLILETGSKPALKTWISYMGIIFLVMIDTLLLTQTLLETIAIIFIAFAVIAIGVHRIYKREKILNTSTLWILIGMLVFEVFGIFFLVYGNYNLGKSLICVGVLTILIGYLTLYSYQLISDIINFSVYIIESDTQKTIHFDAPQEYKITKSIYLLFFISWYIIINRNTYSFQNQIEPFFEAFAQEQKLGSFTYSYQSILIFIFVIVVSVFISKIISFLASESKTVSLNNDKKSNTGSWILLVRIAIISIGISFAFAIAGIPTDRLTVIIGALGVGIGFGLQNLVNNLISGLIIAFEKPVNIDDIIEIGGQTGTMKSIGIRSSVVTTWDGADIIIPNGDILNQHMTNWTMGSTKRRYEIPIGVAYGTDLKLAKSILEEVLSKHPLVLNIPEPVIWVTQFGNNSIDFVIKYWVPHFNYGNDVKSDLIIAIDEAFKWNKIEIPFPQQDVYIKAIEPILIKKEDKNS
jgi:potassium-dependent mechanosensitive channel